MYVVCPGLCDDIDNTAGRASELGVGTTGNNLEFLYRVEGNVNCRALAAELFAEEAVVVVAAVKADVVKDAALAIEIDFVAVRALGNGNARSEGKQIFKFAPEHRGAGNCQLVQGG